MSNDTLIAVDLAKSLFEIVVSRQPGMTGEFRYGLLGLLAPFSPPG